MATPSLEGYKATAAEVYGNNNIQQQWNDVPTYNMFGNTGKTTTKKTTSDVERSKDKEVELGLGKSVYSPMSDGEKQQYLDSLTDDQYRQMRTYKNQGYSFEASRTLLENSEGLANPTALGIEKYQPKGNFLKNMVAGAYDSVTGLPRFLSNNLAKAVGWTAKKLGADEDKVNALVQDFIDFGENEMSGKALGANTNSATYKITKTVGDIAQVAAGEGLAKSALKGTQALNKINQVKNSGLLGKMAVGALGGAADMGLYNIVSESELPTGKDLAIGATLGAAFPLAGALAKATGKVVKNSAVGGAEKLIKGMNKLSKGKQGKFTQMIGEDYGKWMNDRGLKSGEEVLDYFVKSKNKVDEAMASIKGTFTDKSLTDVLDEAVGFAGRTQDEGLARLLELQKKNATEGLTMSEINEVKRYFERNTKFTYLGGSDSEKAKLATNLDEALRNWQEKIAAENGLTNLAVLNKETQAAKYIVNNSYDRSMMAVSDKIPMTDILTVLISKNPAAGVAQLLGKKTLEAPRFKKYGIDLLNWIGRHETIAEKMADIDAIMSINSKKEAEALLKKRETERQALPAPKEGAVNDAGYNILKQGEDMVSLPNGQTIVKDNITEIPNNSNFQ